MCRLLHDQFLAASSKDEQSALQKSNIIYQFSCHCNSQYVDHTFQRLLDGTKQHFPKSICSCSSSQKPIFLGCQCKSSTQPNIQSLASDSTIRLHLLLNPACAQRYNDSKILYFAKGCSPFHLSALEATFIKTFNPTLCRQKEFVYSLKNVHK